ncbi:ribonuclease H-like domain-containing protein [Tanacetum coccineum]
MGRPPKKRKKFADEFSSQNMTSGRKLSRVGKTVTCDTCKKPGHNKRSCKNGVGGSQPSQMSAAIGPQRSTATPITSQRFVASPRSSQRYTLVFQQHQDEPIYDVWTRFKNLIKRIPRNGLDLWSLTQFFYDHVDDYTRMDLDFAVDGNLRELSGKEAWEAIEDFAQGQKEWDPNIISEQEVANLKAQAKRLFGNENVWVEIHRGI